MIALYLIQSMILIIAAPMLIGILKRIKAILRGYKGAPVVQPYFDLIKLLSKDRIHSENSSFITRTAPIVILSSAILSAFLTPVFYTADKSWQGNWIILIFLLSIIKFMTVLTGLDCGSTFGGMGSSRELFISMFAEPIAFLTAAYVFLETGSLNLYAISNLNMSLISEPAAHIMAGAAFLLWIVAENARMPVDNPETHLELTMIHEAMILDISGRDLAYIELSSYIKLTVCITIFINAFIPFGIAGTMAATSLLVGILIFILKMLIIISILAVIEITMAKFRLFRSPKLLATSFCFVLTALVIQYIH